MTESAAAPKSKGPDSVAPGAAGAEPDVAAVDEDDQKPERAEREEAVLRTDEMLRRLAAELDRLIERIDRVERALPALLGGKSGQVGSETLIALQELDLIAQTLAALSGFLRAAVPLRPQAPMRIGAALRSLTLLEIFKRLGESHLTPVEAAAIGSRIHGIAMQGDEVAPGEVELF